ncbi:hypothetical protein ACFQO1_07485 [Jejudonia soesokkakensis]|uniref:Phasin domain-containing protein n=1 Tax=Jejudonia soesokkakensis TaxID=1323432 RepID=A0ABW2MVG3_9FLAO
MATKKQTTVIDTAANLALKGATKVNDLALATTEKAFTTSFSVAEKCIAINTMILKKGFDIAASQQDMAFDLLETLKKKIVKK